MLLRDLIRTSLCLKHDAAGLIPALIIAGHLKWVARGAGAHWIAPVQGSAALRYRTSLLLLSQVVAVLTRIVRALGRVAHLIPVGRVLGGLGNLGAGERALLLMGRLPFCSALLLHLPLFRPLVTPLLLVVETAWIGSRARTHAVVDYSDGTLAGSEKLGALPLVDWGARCLIRACSIDNTLSEVGSVLLETICNVANHIIIAQLAISLKLAQVNQFRQASIWLVLANFVYLALHLDSVTVVVVKPGIILCIGVRVLVLHLFLLVR